jgi:hypothetical protein
MDLDLRTVACNISVALLSSHMLHFNAGDYLTLHATLFLFKSTTFDVTNFVVSGNIHCLKAKHYNSQYAGTYFAFSIRQHNAFVEGRIGVPEVFIRQDTGRKESIACVV